MRKKNKKKLKKIKKKKKLFKKKIKFKKNQGRKKKFKIKKRKVKKKISKKTTKRKLKRTKRSKINKQINLLKNIKFKTVISFIFQPLFKIYRNFKGKQKVEKFKQINLERREKEKLIKLEEEQRRKLKIQELKEEIRIAKERKEDIKNFLRKEQALVRKEQAEKQKRFLRELKIEKQIEKFRKREAEELKKLEKFSLSQERLEYSGLQIRIEKLKEKYRSIRDRAIRKRVELLGVTISETDNRDILLQKEKEYTLERQKIENCLESFYRSAASLCFQLNKRYIPKHKSILKTIDNRFETGEIYIKWDDAEESDFLLLIYIKNNNPDEGVIIEDRTDAEKNINHEFKTNEIFKASDTMVDSLIRLLNMEKKKKAS